MCKINTITIEGPQAEEIANAIAAAVAKLKNTLVVRDEHTAGTLEQIAAPLRVAQIKTRSDKQAPQTETTETTGE